MSVRPPTHVWPSIAFRDARAALGFLREAFGFDVAAAYWSDRDPGHLDHAQLDWPLGGGIMCGSAADSPDKTRQPGTSSVYIVCDDPDALFERATAAGAEVVRPPYDVEYAERSRSFSVRDPEGNTWSFGQYAGE
jgi:uncharacterized glyoxalase superfamily protein PhnB